MKNSNHSFVFLWENSLSVWEWFKQVEQNKKRKKELGSLSLQHLQFRKDLLFFFLFCGESSMNCPSKDGDVTEHAKCLQLILTLGLTIGVWCCLCDHAPLTPINSHVNKQHQYLTHRSLSVLAELPYWSFRSHFNSSISYKRSKTLKALTLAGGVADERGN